MSELTLFELQNDVVWWADSIAPNRSPKDAVVKLVSEASELLDAVLNRGNVESELGDCLILLLDLANMYNIDLIEAGRIKMEINKRRSWRSEDGVIRRNGKTNGK
jgi:NTP pyrophosphatase (non-canonical NTP hydrolase)